MLEMYSGLVNSIETTILVPINETDTKIVVNDTSNIPIPPNLLVIGGSLPGAETVKLLEVNEKTLKVERGFQGTAKAWNSGAPISRNFTEYDYRATIENIKEVNENQIEHLESNVASGDNGVHGLRLNGKNLEFFDKTDNLWRSIGMNTSHFYYSISNSSNMLTLPWTSKAAPNTETINGSCVSIGTDIFILGNGATFKKYSTITNTYSTLATCSVSVNGAAYSALASSKLAVIENEIYALGLGGSNVFVGKYDVGNNKWSVSVPLPQSGQFASNTYLKGFIYLFGTATKCFKYEIATKEWSPIADCPVNANYSKVVAYENSIYFFGGATSPFTKIYRYDTVINVWEEVLVSPYSLQNASISLVGKEVYIFGIGTNTGVYDILENTFTNLSKAPNNLTNSSAVYDGGDLIYVVGSGDTGFNQLNVFDKATKDWLGAKTSCPVDARYSASSYKNGMLYTMIGVNMYSYTIEDDTWSLISTIGINLAYASVTEINGKFFYLGGNATPFNHMLSYDFDENLWTSYCHGIGTFASTVIDADEINIYHIGNTASSGFIIEKYNTISSEWTQLSNAPTSGFKGNGRIINNNLILFSNNITSIYSITNNTWKTGSACPQVVNGYDCTVISKTTLLIIKESALVFYNFVLDIWFIKATTGATAINDCAIAYVDGQIYSFYKSGTVYYAKATTPPDEETLYNRITPVSAFDNIYIDSGVSNIGITTESGETIPIRQKIKIDKDSEIIVSLHNTTATTTYIQGYISR